MKKKTINYAIIIMKDLFILHKFVKYLLNALSMPNHEVSCGKNMFCLFEKNKL